MSDLKCITLNNGMKMPQVGLGVWRNPDGDSTVNSVNWALEAGYRLIDTAAIYKNEAGVGQAVRESSVPREDIFVTTKVWTDDIKNHTTMEAIDTSLEKMGLEYVDLILLHWCVEGYIDAYKELEKAYHAGKVKAIGLSNFTIGMIEDLMEETDIKPMMNQIESHPYFLNQELIDYCLANDIAVTVWRPLGGGITNVMADKLIVSLAEKYNKTPAQIIIRWHVQRGVVVIPKSSNEGRIRQNYDVFDFELSDEDFEVINRLDRNERSGKDPENHGF